MLAATLSLSPSTGSYQVGDFFNVDIILDTEGSDTHGVGVRYLNYNPSLLEAQDDDAGAAGVQISTGSLYSRTQTNLVDTSQGEVEFVQLTQGDEVYNGSGVLATISFRVLTTGTANLTIDYTPGSTEDSNVAFDGSDLLSGVANGSYALNPVSGDDGSGGGGDGGGNGGGSGSSPDLVPPGMVKNLSVTAGDRQISLSWTNPIDSDFGGVLIIRKTASEPTNIDDGGQVMKGNAASFTDTGLTNGVKYYYALFSYDEASNYSLASSISAIPQTSGGGTQYVNGTLLKGMSEKVYILFNDKKTWITSAAIFKGCGFRWEDIITVSDDIINSIGDGPEMTDRCLIFPDNTLIKGSDYKVYLIVEAARRWITTGEIFEGLGHNWNNITVVSDNILADIPEGESITSLPAPKITLMRASNGEKVYAIVGGKKHWVPSPDVFNSYNYNWDNIEVVSQSVLDNYPRIKHIRLSGGEKVYYITESGMKRHVLNPDVFLSYGNNWDDIADVNQTEINAYQVSDLIRLDGGEKIYKIEGGQKRWIRTAEAFNRLGYNWARVAPVNQAELEAYQTGADIE